MRGSPALSRRREFPFSVRIESETAAANAAVWFLIKLDIVGGERQMRGVASTDGTVAPCAGIHAQRKILLDSLAVERRKLEALITEMFSKGRENMGADARILEQSRTLDQLVVDEMMLEEMLKKLG